jgi:hypothetical protein
MDLKFKHRKLTSNPIRVNLLQIGTIPQALKEANNPKTNMTFPKYKTSVKSSMTVTAKTKYPNQKVAHAQVQSVRIYKIKRRPEFLQPEVSISLQTLS